MDYKGKGKIIQSVQRAIDIINCFNDQNSELTLTQISQILDLNKSTVHGILHTLYNNGYIFQNNEGRYLLGQSLLNKHKYLHSTNKTLLIAAAKPYMIQLSNKYKVTSNLFIIVQEKPMIINQAIPSNSTYKISPVSENIPLYCTASGKLTLANINASALENYLNNIELKPFSPSTITTKEALLESLKEIRHLGYSYEDQELEEGIAAISFPIYDKNKLFLGTLSACGISSNIRRRYDSIVNDFKDASNRITKEIF